VHVSGGRGMFKFGAIHRLLRRLALLSLSVRRVVTFVPNVVCIRGFPQPVTCVDVSKRCASAVYDMWVSAVHAHHTGRRRLMSTRSVTPVTPLVDVTSMRQICQLLLLVVASAAIGSCSRDSTGPEQISCMPETNSAEVTVVAGSSVVFDWTPKCSVALLLVEEENGSDMWWISTPEANWRSPDLANKISPPATYGQVPADVTNSFGPEPLIVGTTYKLVLWRILPEGSTTQCLMNFESACLIAVKTFTR
jgi:hypothetical protein